MARAHALCVLPSFRQRRPVPKVSFVTGVGDLGCGVGYYAQSSKRRREGFGLMAVCYDQLHFVSFLIGLFGS